MKEGEESLKVAVHIRITESMERDILRMREYSGESLSDIIRRLLGECIEYDKQIDKSNEKLDKQILKSMY